MGLAHAVHRDYYTFYESAARFLMRWPIFSSLLVYLLFSVLLFVRILNYVFSIWRVQEERITDRVKKNFQKYFYVLITFWIYQKCSKFEMKDFFWLLNFNVKTMYLRLIGTLHVLEPHWNVLRLIKNLFFLFLKNLQGRFFISNLHFLFNFLLLLSIEK